MEVIRISTCPQCVHLNNLEVNQILITYELSDFTRIVIAEIGFSPEIMGNNAVCIFM